MKKMKKLLGAVAALGFTTVAAANVVACNPKTGVTLNVLTKSFNDAYTSEIRLPEGLESVGLKKQSADTYNFNFNDITDLGMQAVITKTSNTAPVNKEITKLDPRKLTADIAENDQIAQVVAKTENGPINAVGEQKTIQYVVTLKLWKADSNKRYVDQNISMDVTISINTIASLKNLTEMYGIYTLNINTSNLKAISANTILTNNYFTEAVTSTFNLFAPETQATEYTVALASDDKGSTLTTLDLTKDTEIYVQFTATKDAVHLSKNSKTAWLKAVLPSANNLNIVNVGNLGTLSSDDFSGVTNTNITKIDIINAIQHYGSLLQSLKNINSNINSIDGGDLSWLISTTANGDDMTGGIDVSKAAKIVYITLTPGTIAAFSGKTDTFQVNIPQLD